MAPSVIEQQLTMPDSGPCLCRSLPIIEALRTGD